MSGSVWDNPKPGWLLLVPPEAKALKVHQVFFLGFRNLRDSILYRENLCLLFIFPLPAAPILSAWY